MADRSEKVEFHPCCLKAQRRLAGRVAHEGNNALTGIVGFAEILKLRTDLSPEARSQVDEILRAGYQLAGLIQKILIFSGRHVAPVAPTDLGALVTELVRTLEEETASRPERGINFQLRLDKSPPAIVCPEMTQAAIRAILTNAVEALPEEGGNIIVRLYQLADPDRLVLMIKDTGYGVFDEVKARCFEPFFSTKEGKAGLGLSLAGGVMEQLGGELEIGTDETGTIVRMKFPIPTPDEPEAAAPLEPARAETAASSTKTILVVDDEDILCRLGRNILEPEGFRVLTANEGGAALAILAAERVDLVLTDCVMPGVGGFELAEKLAAERPGLPLVFMSAYTGTGVDEAKGVIGDRPFLQKPFSPQVLIDKVKEMLVVATT